MIQPPSSVQPIDKGVRSSGFHVFLRKEIWMPFLVSLVIGLLVHSTTYFNGLVSPDGLWNGEYSLAGQWEFSLGRWGLYFVDLFHGGVNASPLAAFLTVFYIAAAGTLLVSLFSVKSQVKAVLIPTMLTCSPMVSMFIVYPYCGDAYALSILLAVLAVYAISRISGPVKRIAVSAICVTLLISLYQSSLGVVLAVAAGYVLLRLLREEDGLKALGKDILHMGVAIVIGAVLYYALTQLVLRIWDVSLGDYKGMGSVSIANILQNIPAGIRSAYIYYRMFFLEELLARNAYFTPIFYCVMGGIALISMIMRFASIGKQRPYVPLLCVVLIVLFPICCNIINVIVPDTQLYLLMVGGMMMTPPLLLAISEVGSEGNDAGKIARYVKKGMGRGGAVVAVALIWVYVLSCQTDASVMLLNKNQTIALANRVWQQVEASEDYVLDDTEILIVGHPQEGNYPNPSPLFWKANVYAQWGTVWKTYDGNIQTWRQVFRQYLGVTYETCAPEQYMAISASQDYRDMPLYPLDGSIQMIDDVLVVKVSDTTEWVE